jgi:hypothetical protein
MKELVFSDLQALANAPTRLCTRQQQSIIVPYNSRNQVFVCSCCFFELLRNNSVIIGIYCLRDLGPTLRWQINKNDLYRKMHHLRDALLGPLSKGPDDLTGLDHAALDRQDAQECAARREFEEMRGAAFYNQTSILTERYCRMGDGVDSLEGYVPQLVTPLLRIKS